MGAVGGWAALLTLTMALERGSQASTFRRTVAGAAKPAADYPRTCQRRSSSFRCSKALRRRPLMEMAGWGADSLLVVKALRGVRMLVRPLVGAFMMQAAVYELSNYPHLFGVANGSHRQPRQIRTHFTERAGRPYHPSILRNEEPLISAFPQTHGCRCQTEIKLARIGTGHTHQHLNHHLEMVLRKSQDDDFWALASPCETPSRDVGPC